MDQLAQVRTLPKPLLLTACATGINCDGEASQMEIELFRAIAGALEYPMPSLVSR